MCRSNAECDIILTCQHLILFWHGKCQDRCAMMIDIILFAFFQMPCFFHGKRCKTCRL